MPTIHRLFRRQRLAADPARAWAFFSDPRNLSDITPPWLGFEILGDPGPAMSAGMILRYRIRLAPWPRLFWTTEITHARAPDFFVDEQRFGPYRFWHHQHRFRPVVGGVEMEDEVHYALPFGPLGGLAHRLYVRGRLERIFDYRRDHLAALFGAPQPPAEPPRAAGPVSGG